MPQLGMNTLTISSVTATTYKCFVLAAIKRKQRKKKMKVNKTIELPNGTVQFQGELSEEELDTVLAYGLNTLLALGAINTTMSPQQLLDTDNEDEGSTKLQ